MEQIYISIIEMSMRVYEALVLALGKLGIPKDPNLISSWKNSFLVDSDLDILTRDIKLLSVWRYGMFCKFIKLFLKLKMKHQKNWRYKKYQTTLKKQVHLKMKFYHPSLMHPLYL